VYVELTFTADVTTNTGVFGVALLESIPYANVAISLFDEKGESYTYGYIPIVVGKCGVFLKERGELPCSLLIVQWLKPTEGTEHANIFTPGDEDKVARLITAFNSPPRYGKGVPWTDYSVLDASTVLYRYLRSLPEPLITPYYFQSIMFPPLTEPFRHPSSSEHQPLVARYQLMLKRLPSLKRQLMLYLLDFFAVFAAKSELNGATTDVIVEYYFSVFFLQDEANLELSMRQRFALGFMIDNQDKFLLGMEGVKATEAEASK
jgi:hypothetical protein